MSTAENLHTDSSLESGSDQSEVIRPSEVVRASMHVPPRETEMDAFKYISSREIAELIPTFDGHNIPVNSFIRCCKSAESLTPYSGQTYLLQLIRTRIRGNADRFLAGQQITSVTKLLNDLKRAYAPARSISQYQIDLSTVQQGDQEIVFDYGMRVNELMGKGLEAIYDIYPSNLAEGMATCLKDCALKSFIRGLKNAIEIRMHGKLVDNLNSAIDAAIDIEQEVEQRKLLMTQKIEKSSNTRDRLNYEKFAPHPKQHLINHMSIKEIFCYRCGRKGHFSRDCRRIAKRTNERVGTYRNRTFVNRTKSENQNNQKIQQISEGLANQTLNS